jgi:hypothetical protein
MVEEDENEHTRVVPSIVVHSRERQGMESKVGVEQREWKTSTYIAG